MLSVFGRELKANWKALLFWSIGMFALCGLGFDKYQGVMSGEAAIAAVTDMMPRMVRVMFGMDTLSIATPEGYFVCMLLFVCLLAFFHAALFGATVLAKEERDKTAEFLFVRPCTRQAVITGKLLAGIVNIAVLNAVAWLTTLVFFLPLVDDPGFSEVIASSYIGMLAVQLLFLCIGLSSAALMGSERHATQLAAFIVLLAYVIMILVKMGDAANLDFLSPFLYFSGVSIIEDGIRPAYMGITIVLVLVCSTFAYVRFKRRDLRN